MLALLALCGLALAAPYTSSPVPGAVLHALEHDRDEARIVTAVRADNGSLFVVACGRVGVQLSCAAYDDGFRLDAPVVVRRADDATLSFTVGDVELLAPVPPAHGSLRSMVRLFGARVAEGVTLDGSALAGRMDADTLRSFEGAPHAAGLARH